MWLVSTLMIVCLKLLFVILQQQPRRDRLCHVVGVDEVVMATTEDDVVVVAAGGGG
jgi:hypothetical protein